MKKNNMLRIASVLLVAVLLSTCAISGAFAKYTTEKSYTDTARVAVFGINVDIAENGGLFTNKVEVGENENKKTVVYSASSDVVAPGMEGKLTNVLTITDTNREVAIKASVDANLNLGGEQTWLVDSAFYCPIKITVGTNTVSGLNYTDADDFKAAVEALIEVAERTYYVGETDNESNPVLFAKTIPSVSWSWAFTADGVKQTDEKDTALGIKGTDPISLTITVNVEQANE